ncbi:MAG: hypothetical protein P1U67_14115 [Alcanivoracaceae bacterium]|nr:hypothetical protein [Alcanivoracaceae bacterium]
MRKISQAFVAIMLAGAVTLPTFASSASISRRPQISDYDDQSKFVADVLAWEQQQRLAAASPAEKNAANKSKNNPHDWHHVTGPENLDTAVHNAEGYVQPNYQEQRRFNRTTHISFPLQKLEVEEMAKETAPAPPAAPEVSRLSEMEKLPEHVLEQLDQLQLFTAQEAAAPTFLQSSAMTTN